MKAVRTVYQGNIAAKKKVFVPKLQEELSSKLVFKSNIGKVFGNIVLTLQNILFVLN
jgi:hypothetical protein